MSEQSISKQTARRYILGRQGLWPGRRWQGKEGVAAAIRQLEKVQVDTVAAVARNHDLVLWSRVDGYQTRHLEELMYQERRFFDWGGVLFIYPVEDMIYMRTLMLGRRAQERWVRHINRYAEAIELVRRELRERGPLGNRDFEGGKRIVGAYRSEKETGQALYCMWQLGELMTHSRRGFDRIYDFTDNVLGTEIYGPTPPVSTQPLDISEEEIRAAERHLALKAMRDVGLGTFTEWGRRCIAPVRRAYNRSEARALFNQLVEEGEIEQVAVEGRKEPHYLPAVDLPLLDTLAAGEVPLEWRPLSSTTLEEANFIAPLDNLIWDRARAKALFDFDYKWEVYKPADQRQYGYYTMPILFGDRLVGRLNPKLDRKAKTLTIDGFWLEDEATAHDAQFAAALAAGLAHSAHFHEAATLRLSAIQPGELRSRVAQMLELSS